MAWVGAPWIRKCRNEARCLAYAPSALVLFWCSFGLKLLSRVRPSEVLLKSVTKEIGALEIVHPAR